MKEGPCTEDEGALERVLSGKGRGQYRGRGREKGLKTEGIIGLLIYLKLHTYNTFLTKETKIQNQQWSYAQGYKVIRGHMELYLRVSHLYSLAFSLG